MHGGRDCLFYGDRFGGPGCRRSPYSRLQRSARLGRLAGRNWQVAIDKGWLKEAGLDRPAFNRIRLKAEKSIGSRVLEQSTSKWTQVALTLSCSGRRTFLTKNSAASLSGGGRPLPLSSIWRWRNGNDLVSVESAASTRLVAVFMTRSRPRLLAAALIA